MPDTKRTKRWILYILRQPGRAQIQRHLPCTKFWRELGPQQHLVLGIAQRTRTAGSVASQNRPLSKIYLEEGERRGCVEPSAEVCFWGISVKARLTLIRLAHSKKPTMAVCGKEIALLAFFLQIFAQPFVTLVGCLVNFLVKPQQFFGDSSGCF